MYDLAESYASKAWEIFYSLIKVRFGTDHGRGEHVNMNRYYKSFLKIAEICIREQFDLHDYLEACFQFTGTSNMYMTPADLTQERVVANYRNHRIKYGKDREGLWHHQVTALLDLEGRLIPDIYKDEEEILAEPDTPFMAWFRVVYPENASDRLIKLYGMAAWSELSKDEALRHYLRGKAPKGVKLIEDKVMSFSDTAVLI
jgi:hypothetical protein